MRITTVLSDVLRPLGFKRRNASWLKHYGWVVVRVSFQASQFGGEGYLNFALTLSQVPIEKQRLGDWDAQARSLQLLPSGREIDGLLRREIKEEEAEVLTRVLVQEAVPILEQFNAPKTAAKIYDPENWLTRNNFETRFDQLCT